MSRRAWHQTTRRGKETGIRGLNLEIRPLLTIAEELSRRHLMVNCINAEAMLNLRNEEKQSETDPNEGGRPHSDKQVGP